MTPSGRFEANREICLSISGHHEETWQPAWGLRTALVALRSFMETDPKGQVGGIETSDAVRRRLAGESTAFVCHGCGGRTNAAILAESAEQEAALQQEQSEQERMATVAAYIVPPELTMAYRDDLHMAASIPETATTAASTTPQEDRVPSQPERAGLAHNVPTPTPPIPLAAQATSPPPSALAPPTIAAGRAAGRIQLQTPQSPPAAQAAAVPELGRARMRARRDSDDGVPLWVDRAIVVLCVLLGAMLLRLLLT